MTDSESNKDLFMRMASIPSTFNQCIVTMNVTEGNLMLSTSRLYLFFSLVVPTITVSLYYQERSQGGSWGARDPPLLQAFFNQTTYNKWRKCHDDILAIVKKPCFKLFLIKNTAWRSTYATPMITSRKL